jgi:thiol-disulfide isomerase/thioredoxin
MTSTFWARIRTRWRHQWQHHMGTLALVVLVVLGVQTWQTRDVPATVPMDTPLTVLHPDGQRSNTTLAQWRTRYPGQPLALHVWAEWCPICRTEEHSISSLAHNRPVLTVALRSGPPEAVARVLAQRQLPWFTAMDSRGELARALGFKAVPAFVVLDAEGRLRAPSVGYTSEIGMRLRLWWASWI